MNPRPADRVYVMCARRLRRKMMNYIHHHRHHRHSPLIVQVAGSEPSSAAQDNKHDAFNALMLGPVYIERQCQRCDYSAMKLAVLFSLKSMETLENGLQTHSGASLQSCRSIDTDAWYKWALTKREKNTLFNTMNIILLQTERARYPLKQYRSSYGSNM